jgi:hypothetical protein
MAKKDSGIIPQIFKKKAWFCAFELQGNLHYNENFTLIKRNYNSTREISTQAKVEFAL